jgi:hypothetical protein
VVLEVPLTGKSVARNTALAAFVLAQEGLVAVSVKSVGLALMAEEAGSRRESGALAGKVLAAVWLQVRVDKFATSSQRPSQETREAMTYS